MAKNGHVVAIDLEVKASAAAARAAAWAVVISLLRLLARFKVQAALASLPVAVGAIWYAPRVGMEPRELLAFVGFVFAVLVGAHTVTDLRHGGPPKP